MLGRDHVDTEAELLRSAGEGSEGVVTGDDYEFVIVTSDAMQIDCREERAVGCVGCVCSDDPAHVRTLNRRAVLPGDSPTCAYDYVVVRGDPRGLLLEDAPKGGNFLTGGLRPKGRVLHIDEEVAALP